MKFGVEVSLATAKLERVPETYANINGILGGRCLPASPRRPLETPLARFRVWDACLRACASCLRYCMVLCYGPVLSASCLSCCLLSEGAKWFLKLECYCASRGGYLGGGASAPRYQGPLERLSREAGRPMGPPTPRCFSQSCAVVCLVSC